MWARKHVVNNKMHYRRVMGKKNKKTGMFESRKRGIFQKYERENTLKTKSDERKE